MRDDMKGIIEQKERAGEEFSRVLRQLSEVVEQKELFDERLCVTGTVCVHKNLPSAAAGGINAV